MTNDRPRTRQAFAAYVLVAAVATSLCGSILFAAPAEPPPVDIPGTFVEGLVVAVVAGDDQAVKDFLNSVTSRKFYVDLAMKSFQNHLAEVTYGPLLANYPTHNQQFVAQRLRSSIDIAVGQALPMLIELEFDGRQYESSVTALVVSTEIVNAVRAAGNRLVKVGGNAVPGPLRRALTKAGRVSRFGGASFKLAEVVATEVLAARIDTVLQRHFEIADARATLVAEFHATIGKLIATDPPSDAIEQYRTVWDHYRNVLLRDLDASAHELNDCLTQATRKQSRNQTIDEQIEKSRDLYPELQRALDELQLQLQAETEVFTERCLAEFSRDMEGHRQEIYVGNRRTADLFHNIEHLGWIARGARAGDENDPGGKHKQTHRRVNARKRFDDALAGVSTNRLQTYADQISVLELIGKEHVDARSEVDREIQRTRLLQALDTALNGSTDPIRGR